MIGKCLRQKQHPSHPPHPSDTKPSAHHKQDAHSCFRQLMLPRKTLLDGLKPPCSGLMDPGDAVTLTLTLA